jgi:hypothetical protein
MAFSEWLLAIAFAGWIAATAVRQIGAIFPERAQVINDWFKTWDGLSLVPVWTFFAPYPAMNDYHLLFRDRLPSGSVTPWTEVRLTPARRWYHGFWNPQKREKKALYDAVSLLRRDLLALEQATKEKEPVVLSFGYLVLLSYVSRLPRTLGTLAVQFAIMARDGSRQDHEPVLVFRSRFHRL